MPELFYWYLRLYVAILHVLMGVDPRVQIFPLDTPVPTKLGGSQPFLRIRMVNIIADGLYR